MKASEVISTLQKLIEEYGDLPVHVYCAYDPPDLEEAKFIEPGNSQWDNKLIISIVP